MFNRNKPPEPEVVFEGRRNIEADNLHRSPPSYAASTPSASRELAPVQAPNATHQQNPDVGSVTVIGRDAVFEGNLSSPTAIVVEGEVQNGTLTASTVTIGTEGRVRGTVSAKLVRISGQMEGDVVANDIDILRCAKVVAEMTYDEIAIERGAKVRGMHKQREEIAQEPTQAEIQSAHDKLASVIQQASEVSKSATGNTDATALSELEAMGGDRKAAE